jgi:hypothetical protein
MATKSSVPLHTMEEYNSDFVVDITGFTDKKN